MLAKVEMEYRRGQLLSKYQGSSDIVKLHQHRALSRVISYCVYNTEIGTLFISTYITIIHSNLGLLEKL
jgi:hypothetical protein